MRKKARHTQRRDRASGVPLDILEHLPPQNQSLPTLLLCALTSDFTGGCPPPPSRSLCQRVNFQLQLIKFLGNSECLNPNPSDGSLTRLTNLPGLLQLCIGLFSLPASRGTGSLRCSNSLEPLRELETVRIKLVKDFIDEPMLVAKFSHPLNCILECVLINSWYVENISSGLGVSNFRPLR